MTLENVTAEMVLVAVGVWAAVDLLWMGLALGALLRKLGMPGAQAWVPVMRWVAAARAAHMNGAGVVFARSLALVGFVPALAGLAVVVDAGDDAPAWSRLALVIGLLINRFGAFIGWLLWVYGSGKIEVRLRAPSTLSLAAALCPHLWASILGWGRYALASRTDEAARHASHPADAPSTLKVVDTSPPALPSHVADSVAAAHEQPAQNFLPPAVAHAERSPVVDAMPHTVIRTHEVPEVADLPGVPPAASILDEPGDAYGDADAAPAFLPPSTADSASSRAASVLAALDELPDTDLPPTGQVPMVQAPRGWPAAEVGERARRRTAAPHLPVTAEHAVAAVPEGLHPVSAPSADDVPMAAASSLAAAVAFEPEPVVEVEPSRQRRRAAEPVAPTEPVPALAESAETPEPMPELTVPELTVPELTVPELTVPELPNPSRGIVPDGSDEVSPSMPSVGSVPSVGSPDVEAGLDTVALKPTRRSRHGVNRAEDSAVNHADGRGHDVAAPAAQMPPVAEPGTPAPSAAAPVSPYLAPEAQVEADPDWLVYAREQLQQASRASRRASIPEPTMAPEPDEALEVDMTPEPDRNPDTGATPQAEPEFVMELSPTSTLTPPPSLMPPKSPSAPSPAPVPMDEAPEEPAEAPAPSRVSWRLVIGANSYGLPDSPVVIGRATSSTSVDRIGIQDPTRTLSKIHARLEPHGDTWWVADMGSTNGTFVRDASGVDIEATATHPIEVTGTLILGDLEATLVRSDGV